MTINLLKWAEIAHVFLRYMTLLCKSKNFFFCHFLSSLDGLARRILPVFIVRVYFNISLYLFQNPTFLKHKRDNFIQMQKMILYREKSSWLGFELTTIGV